MKCNKCNFLNDQDAEFCNNCGQKLEKVEEKPIEQKKEKKKKKKPGCLIFFIVFILLIIFVPKLIKKLDNFEDFYDEDIEEVYDYEDKSLSKKLEDDYNKGLITADEYMMQEAYAIFDTTQQSEKYKDYKITFADADSFFDKFISMVYELSDETILYIYKKYTLGDYEWDVNETEKTNSNSLYDYDVTRIVNADYDLKKLDKVVLSSEGHFLIYYSSSGKYAADDNYAKKIANILEKGIKNYKRIYGLNFEYSPNFSATDDITIGLCSPSTSRGDACKLLKENNIDTKYILSALPVFINTTEPETSEELAYYMPNVSDLVKIITYIEKK